jgi:hypothetical protein
MGRWFMVDGLKRIWKETVIAVIEILSRNLLQRTEKNKGKFNEIRT